MSDDEPTGRGGDVKRIVSAGRRGRWVAVGTIAVLAVVSPFWAPLYALLEIAPLFHEVVGVDVSHHQGSIDWRAVKSAEVEFAYIKATEGGDFHDPTFERNWKEAQAAGVLRGAYHFFTQCRSGLEQARNFIARVPVDRSALPPVVDAEHMGPCRDGPSVADVAAELAAFIEAVAKHFGRRPLIYTTREFDDAYLAGRFGTERFWIRSLVLPPRFRRDQWVFWQYHNLGRREGVARPIDLNVFRGSPADLAAFATGRPHSP